MTLEHVVGMSNGGVDGRKGKSECVFFGGGYLADLARKFLYWTNYCFMFKIEHRRLLSRERCGSIVNCLNYFSVVPHSMMIHNLNSAEIKLQIRYSFI